MASELPLAATGLPPWLTPTVYLVNIIALADGSQLLTWLAGCLDAYILIWLFQQRLPGDLDTYIQSSALVGVAILSFNHVVIRSRRQDFVRTSPGGKDPRENFYVFGKSRPFGSRVKDAILMLVSTRGVGWYVCDHRGLEQ